MTNLIGTYLGQYRLVELVRPGGMSMVYKAHQESLDRFVAVKVLSSNRDPQFAARFKREARAIAALQHHNILPVYDYGEQSELLFLVMQYVENGVTLGDMLGKPLPPSTALRLTSHVLDALDYAHKRGVIHRDIKPANVLMPTLAWPMLADFGIAKLINDNKERLTGLNQIIGTAAYMAPEQVIDRPIDARTDLYAAGVVLYELMTGRVPFDSDTPVAVLTKHVYEPPPPPRGLNPDIPASVEAILLRSLSKDPDARYQTAAEMAAELRRVADLLERDSSRSQITELYEIGVRAFEEGKWDVAVDRLGQLAALNPSFEDAAELLVAAREAQERTKAEARQQIELVRQRRQSAVQDQFGTATSPRSSSAESPQSPATSALRTNSLPMVEESSTGAPSSAPDMTPPAIQSDTSVPPAPVPAVAGGATLPMTASPVTKLNADMIAPSPDNVSVTRSPGSSAASANGIASIGSTVAQHGQPARSRRRLPVLALIVAGVIVTLAGALLLLRPWQGPATGQAGAAPTADAASSATAPVLSVPTNAAIDGPAPTSASDTVAEPVAMPEPTGRLVFQDDFGNKGTPSGLEDVLRASDFSRGFHPPGVYHIIPSQASTSNWVLLPRMAFGDFSLQMRVWDESDELRGNFFEGVIFRARDMTHFYALLLDPRNGKYTVQKYDGPNNVSDLIAWKESPLVSRQQDVNLVRVDGKGATFTFYLNGKQLDSFSDDAYTFGMVGMIANNQDAVNPHPHFDELTIWSDDQPPKDPGLPAEREDPAGNMVLIPGGEFIIGGNERSDSQTHILSLPSFYIDRTEVTNAVYKQCVAASKCSPPRQLDSATHPGYFNDPMYDDYPVIYVTWEQARQFCGWANKRLPNEAEWEKAASWKAQERVKVLYPWSDVFDPTLLNSADSNNIDVMKVGSFAPELNGTVDMAGNVSEWTNSLAQPYPYNEADGREEYPAPGERVFRGGSWAQTEGKARVHNRRAAPPDYPDREIGFRCAVSP